MLFLFSPLPDDKILDWSKLKQIADDILTLSQITNFRLFQPERVADNNFKFDENGRKFSKRVENTVGKAEIACYEKLRYEQFLLFTVFSRDLYCRHVKTRACLGKG